MNLRDTLQSTITLGSLRGVGLPGEFDSLVVVFLRCSDSETPEVPVDMSQIATRLQDSDPGVRPAFLTQLAASNADDMQLLLVGTS